MIHERSNEGKVVDEDWHEFRQRARETAHSPEEFSDPERTEYNLDSDDDLSPAGITGQDHKEYGVGGDPGPDEASGHDIREDPWR